MSPDSRSRLRRKNYKTVLGIWWDLHRRNHAISDRVDPKLLASMPISITKSPFFASESCDLENFFIQPLSQEECDTIFDACHKPLLGYYSRAEKPKSQMARAREIIGDTVEFLGRRRAVIPGLEGKMTLLRRAEWNLPYAPQLFESEVINCDMLSYGEEPKWVSWERADVYGLMDLWDPHGYKDLSDDLPHLACLLRHAAPLDDTPLRSELICITDMMKERMRWHAWKNHQYFPVFCYTFNGDCVRMTQAHFENGILHLRQTDAVPYQMHGDIKAFRMLCRWVLGTPTKSTEWELGYDDEGEDDPTPTDVSVPENPWMNMSSYYD